MSRKIGMDYPDGHVQMVVYTPDGGAVDYRLDITALDAHDVPGGLAALVQRRLCDGAQEYGRASVDRPRPEIDREIKEEIADVVGWAVLADHPALDDIVTAAGVLWRILEESACHRVV